MSEGVSQSVFPEHALFVPMTGSIPYIIFLRSFFSLSCMVYLGLGNENLAGISEDEGGSTLENLRR